MRHFDELMLTPKASDYLSSKLINGQLVLFLGAGVTKGFGLPDWLTLINTLRLDVGLPILSGAKSAEDLQHAADEIQDRLSSEKALIKLIEKNLYIDLGKFTPDKILNHHLIIAIAALLMGSKRGHVSRVVTLNYDNLLEMFLSLFGFVVETIYKLPHLEGSEDVRIYHPHGFIPLPTADTRISDFVILGLDKINERLGTPGDLWYELTRHILDTGFCLFIGMSSNSLSDRALAPLFNTSGKKWENIRPLGIWIVKDSIAIEKENEFFRNNIVPISILEEQKIIEFLLEICQKAAKKLHK
jgi:hypothetical protein